MQRSTFLAGLTSAAAWSALSAPALATGGLDLDRALQNVDIRVLLARDNARRYRGELRAIELPNGRDGVLNTLSLEEYLYGVVPVEMPSSWPYAALEAQAILARTFAMRRRNPRRAYDLIAGSADQEYGGIGAETAYANAAVDASAGTIVMYNGLPASIAYMSCCGGHTEDAGRVWGTEYPYLAGVDCPYCAASPNRNWTVRLPWSPIARAAGLRGDSVPTQIFLDDLAAGGRPGSLRFVTNAGQGTITTTRLREVSGWRLPSSFVRQVAVEQNGAAIGGSAAGSSAPNPGSSSAPRGADMPMPAPQPTAGPRKSPRASSRADDDISLDANGNVIHDLPAGIGVYIPHAVPADEVGDIGDARDGGGNSVVLAVTGSGSGHGVGLCQWGARGMAAAGATGQQIVAYYFPHTSWGAADDVNGS